MNKAYQYQMKLRELYKTTGKKKFDMICIGADEQAYWELIEKGICEIENIGIVGFVVYHPENDKE